MGKWFDWRLPFRSTWRETSVGNRSVILVQLVIKWWFLEGGPDNGSFHVWSQRALLQRNLRLSSISFPPSSHVFQVFLEASILALCWFQLACNYRLLCRLGRHCFISSFTYHWLPPVSKPRRSSNAGLSSNISIICLLDYEGSFSGVTLADFQSGSLPWLI